MPDTRPQSALAMPPWSASVEAPRRADLIWLALAVVALVATGIGLRDPWPADEPRFALLARDMVASGDWLFPRVGGDLYQDKPPLFFWLLAAGYALTGSVRWSFLLPSLFAAFGIVFLVYDLVRRLVDRKAALASALVLLFTVQFLMAMRAAQIDATLCLLVTLSLYGLIRHLVLGPHWKWYFVGGLAAGLGVITKGVGFLPLLILVPYAVLRARGFQPLPRFAGGAKWGLAAAGFLIGVGVWLVPMLASVAASGDPQLLAYRDEILFQQTVTRYAAAWHHVKPWYYFLVEVIPGLWLPLSLLLFWLVPRWRQALRDRDARVWLPLGWVVLVLVFFSSSPGKRGIYLLPALPATVLAAAPYFEELLRRRGVLRVGLALGAVPILAAAGLIVAHALGQEGAVRVLRDAGLQSITPIVVFAVAASAIWVAAWRLRPVLAWPGVLACLAAVWSFGIAPRIDGERSGRAFMQEMLRQVPPGSELGLMAYKEQFLLHLDRPSVNFGHRRWLEGPNEAYDAARWLNGGVDRVLIVPKGQSSPCFSGATRLAAGRASRETWYLVRGPAAEACASRGNPDKVIHYPRPSGAMR